MYELQSKLNILETQLGQIAQVYEVMDMFDQCYMSRSSLDETQLIRMSAAYAGITLLMRNCMEAIDRASDAVFTQVRKVCHE
jgi:hypothetical protein